MYVITPSESATYGDSSVHNMSEMSSQLQGESSQSSLFARICEWCGDTFDPSLWPLWRMGSGRFCGKQCACAYGSHVGWKHRVHRKTMWSVSGLTKAERNATRSRTRTLIRRGELVVPKRCMRCNKKRRLETHHLDYTNPALVRFLCHWCHVTENGIQRDAYRKLQAPPASPKQPQGDLHVSDQLLHATQSAALHMVRPRKTLPVGVA